MLDPTGLMSFPTAPNQPRGIFGASGRRRAPFRLGIGGTGYAADDTGQPMDMTGAPPPIDAAPLPPTDWRKTVGADLMSQLTQTPPNYALPPLAGQEADAGLRQPAPTMRGGFFGNVGQFPQIPLATTGPSAPSDKIAARGMIAPARQKARDKPGFFDRGGAGVDILGGLADGLAQYFGGQAMYVPAKYKERQAQADHQRSLEEWTRRAQLDASKPDYATINNRRVRINPTTGQADVLYTAPQDFDDYAATLGAEPGTEQYDRLVQDYVLRGGGPTATDNYNVREDWRQKNREDLEDKRQGNRVSLQDRRQAGQRSLKGVPTYRQANPLPRSNGRSGAGSGSVPEGATATGPGGAKMIFRGGIWVDLK